MSLTLQYVIVGVVVVLAAIALARELFRKGHRGKKCRSCGFSDCCSRKSCNLNNRIAESKKNQ